MKVEANTVSGEVPMELPAGTMCLRFMAPDCRRHTSTSRSDGSRARVTWEVSMPRVIREQALVLFREMSPHNSDAIWIAGAAPHPITTQKVLCGAKRRSDGRCFFFELGRKRVMEPYTDNEVRAIVMHEWGKQDPEVPEVIRLVAAEDLVHKFRGGP